MKMSVIVPTYTGGDHIAECLRSIVEQSVQPDELVVVVDGPDAELTETVSNTLQEMDTGKMQLTIYQKPVNSGRFSARLTGAEMARHQLLVFVDDRITLSPDYLKVIKEGQANMGMANVIEATTRNIIANTMIIVRRAIHGKYSGIQAKSFKLTKNNFEKFPKGTVIWLPKSIFIGACELLATQEKISHEMSDDTKLLRLIVENYGSIYRDAKAIMYYHPRTGFKRTIKHLYERGPKFVDYYSKPGTKFHKPLVLFEVLFVAGLVLLFINPLITLYGLLALEILVLIFSVKLAKNVLEYLILMLGMPLVLCIFCAGVTRGLIGKLIGK